MITTFSSNLFCPPETGHVFVISGKTIDGAKTYGIRVLNVLDINFKCGNVDDVDIPLQISVRFGDEIIVRNSRLSGEWGADERDENRDQFTVGNPLVAGEHFKIYVFISDLSFHIALNDDAFCTYAFRTPVQDIRTVQLLHDLQAITHFDHRATFPAPVPTVQLNDVAADAAGLEFSNDAPRRFTPGHVLVVTAIPYGNARGMFVVHCTEGATRKQALHFNARFDPEYVVVRNAMNDKLEFGAEERDGAFPFFIDEQFKLAIAFTATEFKFAINGKKFAHFSYRTVHQLERLNGLKITAGRGMHMEVTGVDHMHMGDPECADFQTYSHPEWNVLSVADK